MLTITANRQEFYVRFKGPEESTLTERFMLRCGS